MIKILVNAKKHFKILKQNTNKERETAQLPLPISPKTKVKNWLGSQPNSPIPPNDKMRGDSLKKTKKLDEKLPNINKKLNDHLNESLKVKEDFQNFFCV